jgi:RNA polymerase sigma-70 factor (ECF subfamily)
MGRVADGDARAFEAVYERHHRQALSLATRIVGPGGGAEEATQEAFISLWRGAASFKADRGSLRTWLFTLVRHRSIDSLRRRSTQSALLQYASDDIVERLEAPDRTEDQVLTTDDRDRAHRLLAELPPPQRQVMDLAYFAGHSQSEIASEVGVPVGTVKGRTRLALGRLRQAAEREGLSAA